MIKKKIQQLAAEIHPQIISYRRHLHENPELSFMEKNTSAFVKDCLGKMGIPCNPLSNTGVVAIIKGDKPSPNSIALRADMDALPITEINDIPYVSKCKGIMHACGHDAHTASLLGTAFILQSLKQEYGGTIKFIFQPGEEKLPGGASLMIKDGVLSNPKPGAVIGMHVMPSVPASKISIRAGKLMASMDEITMTVFGRGGHAAIPHHNIDPVVMSAHIILALQQIVSRNANPFIPTVLSFGKLEAKGAINIIPDSVYIEGTFRTTDETWRALAYTRIEKIAMEMAESMGGRCEINIRKGYPVLINAEKLTENIKSFAEDYLGKENVLNADMSMVSEDFSYYARETDSCFYFLGVGNIEKGIVRPLHSPAFNIDENALKMSTGLMAYMAFRQLGN
jgi:amidohydrolase